MTAATVVVALAGLIAVLAFTMTQPVRASVEVGGEDLRVRLHGVDALLCVRRQVVVARSAVVAVRAAAKADVPPHGMRLPGTSFPGVVRAGSYGTGARREFWDVRRASTYLVIDLAPGHGFRRIVLEVDDPVAESERLGRLLAA